MALTRRTAPRGLVQDNDQREVKTHLGAGEVLIAEKPVVVWTVLGSCVAVILRAPSRHVSAICHAQLPSPPDERLDCVESCPHQCFARLDGSNRLKFVTCCVEYMLAEMSARGITNREMACAIVGGASVVAVSTRHLGVGQQNVDMAKRLVEARGIAVKYTDIGGTAGRTLVFNSATGQLKVRPTSTDDE